MPLIKSAIKKLRKDKKRTVRNRAMKRRYKELLKKALLKPTEKNKKAVSAIDKAAKRHVIHKNKAARLKSRVMKQATKEVKAPKKIKEKKIKPKKAVTKGRKRVTKTASRKKTTT